MPNPCFGSICNDCVIRLEVLLKIGTLQILICMDFQWQSMLAPAPAAISAPGGKKSQTPDDKLAVLPPQVPGIIA